MAGGSREIKNHALIEFLQSQTQNVLHRLYTRPSACLAIVRLMSPFERQLVMNLLWLEQPLETKQVTSWVTLEGRSAYEAALKTLALLHILPNSKENMSLHSSFKTGLRNGLTGSGDIESFGVPALDVGFEPLSPEELDVYALERWDTTLHFMVTSGTGEASAKPSDGVLYLLEHSGLMRNDQGRRIINSEGFQFLLQSPHAQLWEFMLSYLRMMAEREDMDMVDILGFFFTLSMMQIGQQYSNETLSPTQIIMVADLRDFGLIYFPEHSTTVFQPTRFATSLTSHMQSISEAESKHEDGRDGPHGFVVLETNYHIYAYTSEPILRFGLHCVDLFI